MLSKSLETRIFDFCGLIHCVLSKIVPRIGSPNQQLWDWSINMRLSTSPQQDLLIAKEGASLSGIQNLLRPAESKLIFQRRKLI
jgi:hypothetical protein